MARPLALPQPLLPGRRHGRRARPGKGAAPRVRPHLPGPQDRGRHRLRRPAAHPPPPPARRDRRRRRGGVVRPDDRHRLRQVAVLHRPDRRQGAARARPGGPGRHQARPGDHRLPDERARQQPAPRAGEVPARRVRRRPGARHLRPVHRPGGRRPAQGDPGQPAGHPAHQLRHAGADAHPSRRPGEPDHHGPGPGVPRLRRTAHLPRPPGRRRGPAHPPGPRGLPGLRPPVRRHLRHDVDGGHGGRPAAGGRRRGEHPVRHPGAAGARHRRDPGPRHRRGPGHRPGRTAAHPRRPAPLRRPGARPAGPLDRGPLRPRRGRRIGPSGAAATGEDRDGGAGAERGVRRARRGLRRRHPRHSGGRFAGPPPGHRAAPVRVPAAPVPLQGRHGLRHPGGQVLPPPHPLLPARTARQRRQVADAAGVLPRVRAGVPDGVAHREGRRGPLRGPP